MGFWADDKHFINNHLMFKILVYKTNGQYTKARKRYEDLEAAAVVEVATPTTSFPLPHRCHCRPPPRSSGFWGCRNKYVLNADTSRSQGAIQLSRHLT